MGLIQIKQLLSNYLVNQAICILLFANCIL